MKKEVFDEFVSRLKYHHEGEGVNDHCTANPLFIVQSLKHISGIDVDYDPLYYWTDESNEGELTDEELIAELKEYVYDGGDYETFDIDHDRFVYREGNNILYQKIGYAEHWEYECAHFTKEAAQAFIARKKHGHRELRIYVESQYWCWEFNSIVDALLSGKIGYTDKE